jgi:hypothetical protein
LALPSSVRGPVDFWALRRLAATCASVVMGWGKGKGTFYFFSQPRQRKG